MKKSVQARRKLWPKRRLPMKYKKTWKAPIPMIVQQMKRRGAKVQGSLNLRLRVRPSLNQAKRRRRNQINGTRVFRKKRWSYSLFPGERRLISLQYSGMLSISLRFHCLSPDMLCTAHSHAKPPRNIHTAREVTLPDSKNNSRRITYGTACVWWMPSLSPLSSLALIHVLLSNRLNLQTQQI